MGTLLFLAFVAVMATAGVVFWRRRTREIARETESRESARAIAMGLVPGIAAPPAAPVEDPAMVRMLAAAGAAVAQGERASVRASPASPAIPVQAPHAAAAMTTPASPAVAVAERPVEAGPAPAAVSRPTPPPDAQLLRTIRRSRFARVGLAYFEATGFRARQQGRESPIDALLFSGPSKVPVMAVRWSRAEQAEAGADEVRAFADAAASLKLPRGTFIAQHGVAADGAALARERGLVVIDAASLAAKFEALEATQHALLTSIALGERK